MPRRARFWMTGLLCLAGCGAPTRPVPADTTPTAPDQAALRERLRAVGGHRFDQAAQGRGCPADQTLTQYIELLERNTAPDPESPGDIRRFGGSCGEFPPPARRLPLDPAADAAHWFCRLDAFTSDRAGDSPWHYELRLRVRRADGAIDLASFACPGAP